MLLVAEFVFTFIAFFLGVMIIHLIAKTILKLDNFIEKNKFLYWGGLIIMTSNIGSQIPIDDNFDYATKKNLALEELKNHFRLEFLNRIDDIILFNKLSKENINHILQNQIDIIQDRINSKGIKISFSDEALEFLSEKGFDPIFGARPLKRLLQDEVLNPLSEVILELGENISEKIIFTKDKYGLKIANKDLKVLSS